MNPSSAAVEIHIRLAPQGRYTVDTGQHVQPHGTLRFVNHTEHKVFVQFSHDGAVKGAEFSIGSSTFQEVTATGSPGFYVFSAFVVDGTDGGGKFARACSMPIIIIKD